VFSTVTFVISVKNSSRLANQHRQHHPIDIRMVDLGTLGAYEDFSDAINDILGLQKSIRQVELATFASNEAVYAKLVSERGEHVALMH